MNIGQYVHIGQQFQLCITTLREDLLEITHRSVLWLPECSIIDHLSRNITLSVMFSWCWITWKRNFQPIAICQINFLGLKIAVLDRTAIIWNKILELLIGEKCLQSNSDFMNKILHEKHSYVTCIFSFVKIRLINVGRGFTVIEDNLQVNFLNSNNETPLNWYLSFYIFPLKSLEWLILSEALCFHGYVCYYQGSK